jgi:hypothetical protein
VAHSGYKELEEIPESKDEYSEVHGWKVIDEKIDTVSLRSGKR